MNGIDGVHIRASEERCARVLAEEILHRHGVHLGARLFRRLAPCPSFQFVCVFFQMRSHRIAQKKQSVLTEPDGHLQ
jgi:hypothetical protein